MSDINFSVKRNFIIKLGKALHKYGTPAFRMEAHLENVSSMLGLKGYFLVTPTSLTFVLWRPGGTGSDAQEYNYVLRVKPGEIDLGQLARVNQLVENLDREHLNLAEADQGLDDIAKRNNTYNNWMISAAFVIGGGGFAMLMSASWSSILCASLLSLIACFFSIKAERSKRISETLEPVTAVLCGLLTVGIAHWLPGINIPIVILSAIIVFIPGLSLTIGLSELSRRELVSGTARVMDALMMLFKLYFGAVLGMAFGVLIFGKPEMAVTEPMPYWVIWLGVLALTLSLAVIFKVRHRDIVWSILAGLVAYLSSRLGAQFLGDSLGPFMGAYVVGIYANAYARISKSPASVVMLSGIVLLVPGSKAYLSLNTAVFGESLINIPNLGSQTFLIFMAIIAGIIFSNLTLPPKQSL